MASLIKTVHVFLPLSIFFFLFLHVVASAHTHRKLNLFKLPITRVLMSSPSPNLNYNAFDAPHNLINSHNNFNHVADKDNSNFNYQDNANNGFTDIADSELFNTYSYSTPSYGANPNYLPISTTNTHQQAQYSNPTAYEFSSPSSASTPSLYEEKFPRSFEAAFPGRSGYGKQSFPSDDRQGLYTYPSDAKSFFYKSPSRLESSAPKDQQSSSKSPSNYEANYNPFHGAIHGASTDINKATQFDELKNNNYVSGSYEFKNEKPVSNYDSFFNSPTVHKNEVEGSTTSNSPFERSKFPLAHDLTYGHVQVP